MPALHQAVSGWAAAEQSRPHKGPCASCRTAPRTELVTLIVLLLHHLALPLAWPAVVSATKDACSSGERARPEEHNLRAMRMDPQVQSLTLKLNPKP